MNSFCWEMKVKLKFCLATTTTSVFKEGIGECFVFVFFFCCGGTEKTFLSLLTTHGPCRSLLPPCIPIRLRVNRLGVWPQHHLEHADVPAEHTTGHLLHPHPGLPHLRLRPGGQLQLHQHRPQHRHSQRHHRSVVLLHLSRSHSRRLA